MKDKIRKPLGIALAATALLGSAAGLGIFGDALATAFNHSAEFKAGRSCEVLLFKNEPCPPDDRKYVSQNQDNLDQAAQGVLIMAGGAAAGIAASAVLQPKKSPRR